MACELCSIPVGTSVTFFGPGLSKCLKCGCPVDIDNMTGVHKGIVVYQDHQEHQFILDKPFMHSCGEPIVACYKPCENDGGYFLLQESCSELLLPGNQRTNDVLANGQDQ